MTSKYFTDAFIGEVEERVGLSAGAWDMVAPEEIILAVIETMKIESRDLSTIVCLHEVEIVCYKN